MYAGEAEDRLDKRFWRLADSLVASAALVIDRPAGTAHPRWPEIVYPLDYGYLAGTGVVDGGGVDAWRGSLPDARVTGVIITVDVFKKDAEVKLLVGCTADEATRALATHRNDQQGAVLVPRP